MSKRTEAIISLAAILHNLNVLKRLAPTTNILAMVKSNAYGHGLIPISQTLQAADALGVACIDEALLLREAGITSEIVLMSGVFTDQDLALAQQHQLQLVIHDPFQLQLLQSTSHRKPLTVWLKLDSGMHRLGFSPLQFQTAYKALSQSGLAKGPIHLMTHLASADNLSHEATLEQIACFQSETAALLGPKSIANSAGILFWPTSHADWNRPGITLYGISPSVDQVGSDHGLITAMTLRSKIIAIHDFKQGDVIGYGGTWQCKEPMRVAAVAIGYGDGYPRHAENGTPTLIHDQICPLVGRVSMDIITVDVSTCPNAKVGDDVVLWGSGLPPELVAKWAQTIAYELVCNVSTRVKFIYQ